MKVDKAKHLIEELKKYVAAFDNYHPQNVKQEAIKLYAELENVGKVAKHLNVRGYRKNGRPVAGKVRKIKIESNDVTEILVSDVEEGDKLHEIVKKNIKKNRRRVS